MPTLPNLGLVTPILGAARGTWDDSINACFALVDAHDHTSGKGVAVPVAGLDIDDDIVMGGNGLTGVGLVDFTSVAALSSGANVLFTSSADGELYWRTTGGTNVKLTDGTSINTTLVGGIVGDYSSVGAEVAFDDSDQAYTFKDQSSPTKKWATVACGPVRIYDEDTTESVYLEHRIDSSLASSYSLTWPAALPADAARLFINPSGALEYQSLTKTLMIPGNAFKELTGAPTDTLAAHTLLTNASEWRFGNSLTVLSAPLPVFAGDTIKSLTFYVNKASDTDNVLTVSLHTYSITTGAITSSSTATLTTSAPGATTIPIPALTVVTDATHTYAIEIKQSDALPSAVDKFFGVAISYQAVG